MNGLTLLAIVVGAIGILLIMAYLLDRRSKNKGNILSGGKQELIPAQGKYTYLFLAIFLSGAAILLWGFGIQSGFLQILAGIVILGSLILRFIWTIKTLEKASNK